jgi:rod shape-determining protein MreC
MKEHAGRCICGCARVTMDSFLTRFKNPLVLIAIVLLQVIALAVQVQRPGSGAEKWSAADGRRVAMLRGWSIAGVVPVERVMHGSGTKVRGIWDKYVDLRQAQSENQQLKQEVARLREEQAAFAEDAAQGRRLQALLDFKEQYVTRTVAAQVIGTSGSERSRVLTLDKGSADGLKPDQPVITPDGAVGKIRDVFPHSAQLLLLNDATSGAGVVLATTRIRGILRGTASGGVEIDNLTADSRIKPGEKVLTSGGDMVFPRGLPVGSIVSIAPDPTHQPYTAIMVQPAANLARLEEVLVITGTSDTMPSAAVQDAATAAATAAAEANQKAADLNAEKLPSLHSSGLDGSSSVADGAEGAAAGQASSDDPESQVGVVPGIPNSGLPKPKPVVHPDRFSVGAAGPADLLQPGGSASGLLGEEQPESKPKVSAQGAGPHIL